LVRFWRSPRGVDGEPSGRKRGCPSLVVLRGGEEAGMSGWLRAVLMAVALMVGTWTLLVLLARRLGCSATWPASCPTA
jgi:hypothetical protein